MAAPTFVASGLGASSWSTTTSPKTASVTTSIGDVLVVFGSHSDVTSGTLSTPTGGTGLTWTLQRSFVGSGAPTMYLWTATAVAAETFNLSVAVSGSTDPWSFRFYQWGTGAVVGASVITSTHTTGAPSQALTTTVANSAVMCLIGDTNESAVTTKTWRAINSITPTVGNGLEKDGVKVTGAATFLSAYWNDAGATGSKTLGLTTQTGADYSMASIEIVGSGGGAVSATVTQVAGTVTATGGTQAASAGALVNATVTQVAGSVTATGGTQAIVGKTTVAQVAGTVTATGGTQVVATTRFAAVAQVAGTVTATGGTQVITVLPTVSVAQVAGSVIATGGTQALGVASGASVAQSAGHVIATGGTQSIQVRQTLAQVGATVTARGGTQAITASKGGPARANIAVAMVPNPVIKVEVVQSPKIDVSVVQPPNIEVEVVQVVKIDVTT